MILPLINDCENVIKRVGWNKKEVIYLIKIISANPDDLSLIKKTYHLSDSTFYRLKWMTKNSFRKFQEFESKWFKENAIDQAICSTLKEIVKPPRLPLIISKIADEFKERTSINLGKGKINRYMKGKINYSYKKGSFRPLAVKDHRFQLSKWWFSAYLFRHLLSNPLIMNLDESSFDRSVRQDYSWIPVGVSESILNRTVEKKSSLLLSVFPDGEWIGMIKSETIKSEEFSIYLLILSKMIQELHWDNRRDVYILLDNAKVHHSFTTLKFITALRLKMIYLPAYSPEFAPVELWFKGIKSILKADISPSKLDYSKEDGALAIENALASISKEYIQDCWLKAIKQLEEWVCEGFRQDLLFRDDPEQLREAQE